MKNQKFKKKQAQRVMIAFATLRRLKKYRKYSDDELVSKVLGNLEQLLKK